MGGGGSCRRYENSRGVGGMSWENFRNLDQSRKSHLQHSENTFCKKLGFQNTVLIVNFVINHMLSIENQQFRENIP